ncbi:MAG: DUF6057 family protein [Prevotella sp.]|nr:DUF6057 family protein [Prevotella sp.]
MKHIHIIYTLLFGVAVLLFFGMAYPHHLHYQEQFQLFLFDDNYTCLLLSQPGGLADLLGRFCTQFFLFAWVGALIIALLLCLVQLLMHRLIGGGWLYGLSFVPSFLLWLFLLDEHALMSGVWALLLTLLVAWIVISLSRGKLRYVLLIVALPILYYLAGPVCCPIPVDSLWSGAHYYRYPAIFPWLLWGAAVSVWAIGCVVILLRRMKKAPSPHYAHLTFALVAVVMGVVVWKSANFKAEKVMQYDFMACHQQWNRILETVNREQPNNQVGVTVQNLALAMQGLLLDHIFDYHQNGIAGLLPDVQSDAFSSLPTAEAFYQLGMINVAQRTVFEAQEAILDFQKSARSYKRLAQTNLINGQYEVARKYLSTLQKTLFYRDWADETLLLLGNEQAIAAHPEYGRLRQWAYKDNFYFSDHVTPEMLESLYYGNPDNHMAYQYLLAYYLLTGDRERYQNFISRKQ